MSIITVQTLRALQLKRTHRPLPVELHQIEAFVAVCECGTVVGAADLLRIAQPAVSRKMKLLETRLGVALFVRTRGRLYLTVAGENFLRDCRVILHLCKRVVRDARVDSRAIEWQGSAQSTARGKSRAG